MNETACHDHVTVACPDKLRESGVARSVYGVPGAEIASYVSYTVRTSTHVLHIPALTSKSNRDSGTQFAADLPMACGGM